MAKPSDPAPSALPASLADLKKLKPVATRGARGDLPSDFDQVLAAREVPDWAKRAEHAFAKMVNADPGRLSRYPNVIGAGLGVRIRKGQPTDELTLIVPGLFSGALVEHLDAAGGDLNLSVRGTTRPLPNVARNQQCGPGRSHASTPALT